MRIVMIADTFPPMRSSGAVQVRDISHEFVRQGHSLCVLLPACDQTEPWKMDLLYGVQVLRLKAPRIKDVGYLRRTLAELMMPFFMLHNLRKSPMSNERWEGVVWYSPSIFHGPLVGSLKKRSTCKSYLIIRDIFPQWAVDMGLIRQNGLLHCFFDAVARYQYSVADIIGVQSPGNLHYFHPSYLQANQKLEVLQNWLARPGVSQCSIRINETALTGRRIFVYAGNMGIAQGLGSILDLADRMRFRKDVGFLMVGRGSEMAALMDEASLRKLENIVFFDEIDPDEITGLYAQCDAGIVALDSRHKSHNIPGKFLTYMQNGLPVLANINPDNDLVSIIRDERVGQVCDRNIGNELMVLAEKLLDEIETDPGLPARCHALFERKFAVEKAVKQVVSALFSRECEAS